MAIPVWMNAAEGLARNSGVRLRLGLGVLLKFVRNAVKGVTSASSSAFFRLGRSSDAQRFDDLAHDLGGQLPPWRWKSTRPSSCAPAPSGCRWDRRHVGLELSATWASSTQRDADLRVAIGLFVGRLTMNGSSGRKTGGCEASSFLASFFLPVSVLSPWAPRRPSSAEPILRRPSSSCRTARPTMRPRPQARAAMMMISFFLCLGLGAAASAAAGRQRRTSAP